MLLDGRGIQSCNTPLSAAQGRAVTTIGILVLRLSIIFGILVPFTFIIRIIGRPGIEILSRVSRLILASICVNGIV